MNFSPSFNFALWLIAICADTACVCRRIRATANRLRLRRRGSRDFHDFIRDDVLPGYDKLLKLLIATLRLKSSDRPN
jgi:hypothetical protein